MTPDEVVARARELEDQEVLLTVRGTVRRFEGDQWGVYRGVPFTVMLNNRDCVHSDLVSIEPAPLRIEPGAYYRNGEGELLRGDSDGGLQGFDGYIDASEIGWESDIVRVKVVDA